MSAEDLCGGSAVGLRRGIWASSSLKGEVACVLRHRCCRQAASAPRQLPIPGSLDSSHPPAVLPRQRPPSRAAAGGVVTPASNHRGQQPRGRLTEEALSPVSSATKRPPGGVAQRMGSSTKRKKTPENSCPASEKRQKRRRWAAACTPTAVVEGGRAACGLCRGPLSRIWPSRSSHMMITFLLIISRRGSRGFLGSSCPPDPLRSTARGAFPRPRGPAWTGLTSPHRQKP